MKKILGLTVSAMMVMGLVGGGTWAFFSDTETSTGNVLQAGTLDLNLNGGDSDIKIIDTSVSNIYPGISSSNYTTLLNAGSIAGELDIAFSGYSDDSTSTTEYGDGTDNISNNNDVDFSVWIDVDENGSWGAGDIDLEADGSAVRYEDDNTLDAGNISPYLTQSWDDVFNGTANFTNGTSARFYMSYSVNGANVGNEIQEDSISWDITFTLEQDAAD